MHMVGILVYAHGWHVDRGIWLMHSIDDIFLHIVCTWLMYIGVVHDGHTIWYMMYLVDSFVHDSLFHC
jgi:hypothetical protein